MDSDIQAGIVLLSVIVSMCLFYRFVGGRKMERKSRQYKAVMAWISLVFGLLVGGITLWLT